MRLQLLISMWRSKDPLHIMGMQPIWRTKQKKFSLLGIEIYSRVNKSYCSVLQIGCISTDVQGVYYDENLFRKERIKRFVQ